MQKRLLLDGCSYTYGLNLPKEQTLQQHFIDSGYDIINLSRPGKSNQAIAMDVYNNIDRCDILVVGWTFSARWYLKYHEHNIDLLPTRENVELPHTLDSNEIEQSYRLLHKSLYSLFDSLYWNQHSDMLVDLTAALAAQHNKQAVFFSWEPRQCQQPVYYPHVMPVHRLPCGHLNKQGTANLFGKLTHIIEQ